MPAGRPKKNIDPKVVVSLAKVGCTMEEIGLVVGCSVNTLERNFGDIIKEGKANLKHSLRRQQVKRANAGSDTMLIWLGKQLLGQKDKQELSGNLTLSQVLGELDKGRADKQ